jgi:hypothetical protein
MRDSVPPTLNLLALALLATDTWCFLSDLLAKQPPGVLELLLHSKRPLWFGLEKELVQGLEMEMVQGLEKELVQGLEMEMERLLEMEKSTALAKERKLDSRLSL